jgi:phosphoribosylanthranilate isomerase
VEGVFAASDSLGRTFVKICGITNLEDAMAAIDCGADALGVNLYRRSQRYVELSEADGWLSEIPNHVPIVAVMVDPTIAEALDVARRSYIYALQLHGNESPEFCRTLAERGHRVVKAIRVRDESSLSSALSFPTRTVLLDSHSAGFGGSGVTFPWRFADEFVKGHPDLQVFLAGGLTDENVGQAIREVRPFGVDVTSGVESSPGHKAHSRMAGFIQRVREISR